MQLWDFCHRFSGYLKMESGDTARENKHGGNSRVSMFALMKLGVMHLKTSYNNFVSLNVHWVYC